MNSAPVNPLLAGKTIVVTRPRAQADALAAAIRAIGATPFLFPLLTIGPPSDPSLLQSVCSHLGDYSIAVFISPNAVDYSLPTLLRQGQGTWPKNLIPAAVGPGTVRALAVAGIPGAIAPQKRFDSEALLELPLMQTAHVAGRRILILRGETGRELLAESLRERGATVDCIPCYSRHAPPDGAAPLLAQWHTDAGIDAFTVSSSEGLRYLVEMLDAENFQRLANTPVFVPHARIAEQAEALGLRQVVLTAAADAGIIEGLQTYNWSRS